MSLKWSNSGFVVAMGATTAEELLETAGGVDTDSLPFLCSFFPISRYCSIHVRLFYPFSLLLLFSCPF